jgi:hypothetical protein
VERINDAERLVVSALKTIINHHEETASSILEPLTIVEAWKADIPAEGGCVTVHGMNCNHE